MNQTQRSSRRLRILAIVPVYNEEALIEHTVRELCEVAPWCDYVVVNDGSIDNTEAILREKGINHLELPCNLGLDGAFQAGMQYALENGYDYAIQFDGDGQHDPSAIADLLQKARESNADIVIGSRFVHEKRPFTPRMVGSTFITSMIRLTTGAQVGDPTSGMRLFNRSMIRTFANNHDLAPEPDSLALLIRKGAKVEEVQVRMRAREAGESYLNIKNSMTYMLREGISILFIQWFRKKEVSE